MALQANLDIAELSGTGPRGRIVKNDILSFLNNSKVKENNLNEEVLKVSSSEKFVKIPNSNMRKIIADRLSQSKREIPHFYLTVDCQIDELLSLRKDLNSRSKDGKFKLSINDFVISDSYGDGLYGSQWSCEVDGDYTISDQWGNVLAQLIATNGDFVNFLTSFRILILALYLTFFVLVGKKAPKAK